MKAIIFSLSKELWKFIHIFKLKLISLGIFRKLIYFLKKIEKKISSEEVVGGNTLIPIKSFSTAKLERFNIGFYGGHSFYEKLYLPITTLRNHKSN